MKIMVLNNDQTGQAVIEAALKKAGHEILKVENSQDAWDRLERGESRFVIADGASTDITENEFVLDFETAIIDLDLHLPALEFVEQGADPPRIRMPGLKQVDDGFQRKAAVDDVLDQ